MKYYKIIEDEYILAIGTDTGGEEITEAEYEEIMAVIRNKPERTETTDYRLKEDLTWEEYEVDPPGPYEPTDEDKAEAYDILVGEGD